jgi:GT2 family glycosyltransferase
MPGSGLVSVVIPAWNQREHTLECTLSVLSGTYSPLRVVVVDNGSQDDTAACLSAKFPRVAIIRSPINLGFAGACNIGIRQCLHEGADHILLLNNDTVVASDAVVELLKSARPGVGIVAPKILYRDAPEIIWSMGGRRNGITLEVADAARGKRDLQEWPPEIDQDQVAGCAMLLSRAVIERVGLLDERFFLYYEDADYCVRVKRAGFRILVCPRAIVWHKVAVSSGGADSPRERYWMGKASILFFRKHAQPWQIPAVGAWRLASCIKTLVRLVRSRKLEAARAYLRGLRDGLAARPTADGPGSPGDTTLAGET